MTNPANIDHSNEKIPPAKPSFAYHTKTRYVFADTFIRLLINRAMIQPHNCATDYYINQKITETINKTPPAYAVKLSLFFNR